MASPTTNVNPIDGQQKEANAVKLAVHDNDDCFYQLQDEWNDLLHRSVTDIIFATWEWQATWWNAYCPGDLWVISARDAEDRLIGIAPLFVENNPANGRVLAFIGCEDVTDYLDFIVDAEHSDAVYAAFAQFLAEHRETFDSMDLCNIPQDSPTRERLVAHLQEAGFEVTLTQQEVCPQIQLPDSFDDYLAGLNKKQRHEIRRKIRRLEGQAEVDWYVVDASHDLDEQMDLFLHLMASSDPEKEGFLQDEANVKFFKQIVPTLMRRGWLRMNILTVDGKPAAAYLNFDYNQRILVYNSGLDLSENAHLSPGIVLLAYLIEEAIANQREVFDLLRGTETYKYRMGGQDYPVFNLKARYAA